MIYPSTFHSAAASRFSGDHSHIHPPRRCQSRLHQPLTTLLAPSTTGTHCYAFYSLHGACRTLFSHLPSPHRHYCPVSPLSVKVDLLLLIKLSGRSQRRFVYHTANHYCHCESFSRPLNSAALGSISKRQGPFFKFALNFELAGGLDW